MNQLTKTKYWKPDEFIHNASNFNRAPLYKQFRNNSINMVHEAQMKKSLESTLSVTDVWSKD